MTVQTQTQNYEIENLANGLASILAGGGGDVTMIEYFVRADLQSQRKVIRQLAEIPAPAEFARISDTYAHFEERSPNTTLHQDRLQIFLFWWGYQARLPTRLVKSMGTYDNRLETTRDALQTIATGQRLLFPYVEALARTITDDYHIIRQISTQEASQGVAISACWICPTLFIPAAIMPPG